MNRIYSIYLSVFLIILFSIPSQIKAGTKTWLGNTNDWNTISNWNPASLPSLTDDIIIPSSPSGGNMPVLSSGSFAINKLTINTSGLLSITGGTLTLKNVALINGTLNINSGAFDLSTNNQKITIDGGTINQSGGIVSTKDMELKNGGVYNQTNGEFQISHDLKVPAGNSFNGTGGTVHFIGAAGNGADYSGNVQFHNVFIDNGADYNSNKTTDNIKISGNFINNNPNLDNDKGTVIFNGTTQQTIFSASTPPGTKTTFGNLVVNNPAGVRLLSDIGVHNSFNTGSGGYLITDVSLLYVNGSIYEGPLPVELTSFSAAVIGKDVKLSWKTATEINNYGFEIERKILKQVQNANWEKIGFVNGNGNSNSPKSYSFVDDKISTGNYSYRLKQIDNDGQYEYSKTIEVDVNGVKEYKLTQNYPNPFNPATTIQYILPQAGNVKLTLYNLLGQEIRTLVNEMKEAGTHTINIDASDLNSGMYIYKIESGSFVQTRKMTLVK